MFSFSLLAGGRFFQLPNRSWVALSPFLSPWLPWVLLLKARDCLECQCLGGSDEEDFGTLFGGWGCDLYGACIKSRDASQPVNLRVPLFHQNRGGNSFFRNPDMPHFHTNSFEKFHFSEIWCARLAWKINVFCNPVCPIFINTNLEIHFAWNLDMSDVHQNTHGNWPVL